MDQRSDQTTTPIDTFSRSDVMRLHVAPLLNIASIVFEAFPSARIELSACILKCWVSDKHPALPGIILVALLRSVKHKSLRMRTRPRVADPYRYHELLDGIFLTWTLRSSKKDLRIENIGLGIEKKGEKWYQKVIRSNEMCGNTSTAGSVEPPVARPEAALPGPNESKHIYIYISVYLYWCFPD